MNKKIQFFINIILIFSLNIPPCVCSSLETETLAPEAGWIQNVLQIDNHMAGILWDLFKWARSWKSRALIGPTNLKKWFTTKPRRILPTQTKDMLFASTTDSTLVFYPEDMNGPGTKLPNSKYRIYRMPRSIDIQFKYELEAIFKQAENIKMAEKISDELALNGRVTNIIWGKLEDARDKDTLVLNPTVFFWVQRILLKNPKIQWEYRYELERRLFFAVLFQETTALTADFREQLIKFSPRCSNIGKWLDLVKAEQFILTSGTYKDPQLLIILRDLAKKTEEIYTSINASSPDSFLKSGYDAEKNSIIHVFSSLKAISRIINKFGVGEDFNKPENITARLISYFIEERKDADLFAILDYLRETLEEYIQAGIKGLEEILGEINEASKRKDTLESLEVFRKQNLGNILIKVFQRIPKADIHHHLDGSISPNVAFKILQKYPQLIEQFGNPKSPEDLKKYIEFNYKGEGEINWDDLFKKFELFYKILNTDLNAVRIAARDASLEDFNNDGVTLIEHKLSIITPGLDLDPAAVLEATVRGLIEAEGATGGKLQTGLILCIWKDPRFILGSRYGEVAEKAKSDPEIIIREAREAALKQVKIVVDLKKRWERERPEYASYLIGIDTVGDEKDYIREVTAPALQYAAENGFKVTEHLGENWNPGELRYALIRIKQGIESGTLSRIGHATALGIDANKLRGRYTDGEIDKITRLQEEIKELVRKNNIHIETNPSSNLLLVPEKDLGLITNYQDHPVIRFYRELGNVSINTDDSWILHTRGLSGEFMKVWLANPRLTIADIRKIIENGFRASFIHKIDSEVIESVRLRHLIHDIRNRYTIISQCIAILLKPTPEEFETLHKDATATLRKYDEIRNSIDLMAGIDYLRSNAGILHRLGNWILDNNERYPKGEKTDQIAQMLLDNTIHFLNLLNEFELDKEEKQGTETDIIKVIKQLSLATSCAQLEIDIPQNLPEVLVPSNKINTFRVFWNMIGNSLRALEKKIAGDAIFIGKIKISLRLLKGTLQITVEDNGSGIPEELLRIQEGQDRPWIFIESNTTKTDEPGEHGLGLSYVWDTVVNKWNGRISVESTLGKGAKFILEIPAKDSSTDLKINLDELIPSPWDENDPIVTKFIQEAVTAEAIQELKQLSNNELWDRLCRGLQEPGIGLPGSPSPSENWWRHVIVHLAGTVIGIDGHEELGRKLEPIRKKYQNITDLLKEWLRRKWKKEILLDGGNLPDLRPDKLLGDLEKAKYELIELVRSS